MGADHVARALLRAGLLAWALGACASTPPRPVTGADSAPRGGAETSAASVAGPTRTRRPAHWATPLAVPGLPNLHRVDDGLYRSAQPEAQGLRALVPLGVKTIVNLRSSHSDDELIREAGVPAGTLGYEEIPMTAWNPEREQVVRFLRIAREARHQPVLVHCQHGADRTGLMIAAYRMVEQGWSRSEAMRELREGGYGFHEIWAGSIVPFLKRLDVEQVRREVATSGAP